MSQWGSNKNSTGFMHSRVETTDVYAHEIARKSFFFRVFETFAGSDGHRLYQEMRGFPPVFYNAKTEQVYARLIASAFVAQSSKTFQIYGVMGAILIACVAPALAIFHNSLWYLGPIFFGLFMIFASGFAYVYSVISQNGTWLEMIETICETLLIISLSGFFLAFSLTREPQELEALNMYSAGLNRWSLSVTWSYSHIFVLLATTYHSIRLSRTLLGLSIFGIVFIFHEVFQMIRKNPWTTYSGSATRICLLLCFLCPCIFVRLTFEWKERLDLWRKNLILKRVRQTEERLKINRAMLSSQSKEETGGSSTAVEDILALLNEAKQIFRKESMSEIEDVLDEAVQLMTSGMDIHAVRVRSTDLSEEASVLRQFVGDKNLQKLSPTSSPEISMRHDKQSTTGIIGFEDAPAFTQDSMETFRECGKSWSFEFLSLRRKVESILYEAGYKLLYPYIPTLQTEKRIMATFLYRVNQHYLPNSYHNNLHGAFVAHATTILCETLGVFSSPLMTLVEQAGIIISALAHDVGHPGRNNMFYNNSLGSLSIVYNNISVLEQYHCALLMRIALMKEADIFANLSPDVFSTLRKNIIDTILVTDMKSHFEMISRFRVRKASADFDPLSKLEDLKMLYKLCIKMADIGHATVDWGQHLEWSWRVSEEFFQQGDEEFALGLPISPLCDRKAEQSFAKSQKGFLEFVVLPLVQELVLVDPGTGFIQDVLLHNLDQNKEKWISIQESGKQLKIPQEILDTKTSSKSLQLDFLISEELVLCPKPDSPEFDDIGVAKQRRKVQFGENKSTPSDTEDMEKLLKRTETKKTERMEESKFPSPEETIKRITSCKLSQTPKPTE
eukprot:GHVP01032965.1.p1 GENE.GHVP01032965.1~~GHVP01032965.1.p1  ORF type:complete len:843 (+),score=142.93 GHVP01032965.1:5315-7843(+)